MKGITEGRRVVQLTSYETWGEWEGERQAKKDGSFKDMAGIHAGKANNVCHESVRC